MNTYSNWAPVALFCYKRIEHLRKTVSALKTNIGAEESVLYIYSDAPKNETDWYDVQSVREFIKSIDGFKNVVVIEREENFGLSRNIVEAVSSLVNEFGKVIVLEDDIVTSPAFLQFMNEGLKRYKDESKVMAISAWQYPMNTAGLREFYFEPWFACWGWATWADAWAYYRKDAKEIQTDASPELIKYINYNGTYADPWNQLLNNLSGKINTWAIFFFIAICREKGLVLAPRKCYAHNIGFDGTGEDCGTDDIYGESIRSFGANKVFKFPSKVNVDKRAIKRIMRYHTLRSNRVTAVLCRCVLLFRLGGLKLLNKRVRLHFARKRI